MKKVLPKNAILIPENASKVFNGQIFDVYQWPQQLFDGSKATFEMLKRPDTVQIIAIRNTKIILVHDEQPGREVRTHFPGGRVDETDESWLGAAQRELHEETGLKFKSWRLITVEQPQPKIEWFVPFYLASDLESETAPHLDPGERIEVAEWSFEKLKSAILSQRESTLNYAIPLFTNVESLDELLGLPQFVGKEVDLS